MVLAANRYPLRRNMSPWWRMFLAASRYPLRRNMRWRTHSLRYSISDHNVGVNRPSKLLGAQLLRRELGAILPDLADVRLTHSWTGNVGFTLRELPGIGCRDGLWYALGCNGSGVALMPYLGHKLADKIIGARDAATAFDDLSLRPIPLYWGDPWFRPLMTAWYRLRDRIG